MKVWQPSYLSLYETGELNRRCQEAQALLASCQLCPRSCGVDRMASQTGFCRTGFLPNVSSYNAHHGEEPPISGTGGSGTIFFSHCNLSCVYCQNWPISQQGQGREVGLVRLAEMMIELQERGCHNINFVTPSHLTAQIIMTLEKAIPMGFHLPLVFNTSGYDAQISLKLLDGIIDIYMPDIRYAEPKAAEKYSGAKDYPAVNQAAFKEMWRQVGQLKMDDEGIAIRGMLVRHLVLPNGLSQTRNALEFIAKKISPEVYLSLMAQYFPGHKAGQFPELNRQLSSEEYQQALDWADGFGLENGWRQKLDDSGGGPKNRIIMDR